MSSEPLLRIARVLHGTTAEGPGNRTAVWVQGCSIRCKGCINPHLFDPRGGRAADPRSLAADAVDAGVEGLTLLGGEPFDQPRAVAALATQAQALGLGVICFTGNVFEELAGRPDCEELLSHVDLLVDGPFLLDAPERRRALVGSTNQRFLHLSDRYVNYAPDQSPNRLDVRISADGGIDLAGFVGTADLQDLAKATVTRRSARRPPHRSSTGLPSIPHCDQGRSSN